MRSKGYANANREGTTEEIDFIDSLLRNAAQNLRGTKNVPFNSGLCNDPGFFAAAQAEAQTCNSAQH